MLLDQLRDRNVLIITDRNLKHFYGDEFVDIPHILIPPGESAKSTEQIKIAANLLLENGADRTTHLIAFGGGSVCDFTGFLAGIFMRGISFSFVPTSLLAMADASVGGKTGINLGDVKNMLGLFMIPDNIFIDPRYILTQKPRERNSGYAEIVKHALIYDQEYFYQIEDHAEELLKCNLDSLSNTIARSIEIKLDVVDQDYKESGLRKVLNFGHSIGHALELQGDLLHGEAVSIGMCIDLKLSNRFLGLSEDQVSKGVDLLKRLGLPSSTNIQVEKLISLISYDKKRTSQRISYPLIKAIGTYELMDWELGDLGARLNEVMS